MASTDPKIATQGQWEDLVDKVQAKADSSSVPAVVQTTGSSTTSVMSQKAVTDIIGDIETALSIINNGTGV